MTMDEIIKALNEMVPDVRCELDYTKDYELLISTVMAAQSTDKRVNTVAKDLWGKYDLKSLAEASVEEIETMIKPVGTYHRKALYLKEIAKRLLEDHQGIVPNDRDYIEKLPGVGHKTANVVLSNIYGVPCLAVDTHVTRVSKRLSLALEEDDVLVIEQKLMKLFPEDKWIRLHMQLVLFGRYLCKAKKPECKACHLKSICKEQKK